MTVGAIHTRWRTKSDLFMACVEPLLDDIRSDYDDIFEKYFGSLPEGEDLTLHVRETIGYEADVIIETLYEHYDESFLLFCRSSGSNLENFVDRLVDKKTESSVSFFRSLGVKKVDETLIRIIVTLLVDGLVTIFRTGCTADEAKHYLAVLSEFNMQGYEAIRGYMYK